MKITTKERYSLRLLFALSKNYRKRPVPLREISKSENIPHKYLTQIILVLKSAGLVNSFPGVNGGYLLTKSPKEIKYLNVFEAFQGKLAISNCINYPKICNKSDECKSRIILKEITDKFAIILNSYSIQDLVDL